MRRILMTAATLFAATLFAGTAFAQCQQKDVNPADAGYKTIEVRRPSIVIGGERVTRTNVEISLPFAEARNDKGTEPARIVSTHQCQGAFPTGLIVDLVADGNEDRILIPVPSTTKPGDLKIRMCSQSAGCFYGTLQAFDQPVKLVKGETAKPAAS